GGGRADGAGAPAGAGRARGPSPPCPPRVDRGRLPHGGVPGPWPAGADLDGGRHGATPASGAASRACARAPRGGGAAARPRATTSRAAALPVARGPDRRAGLCGAVPRAGRGTRWRRRTVPAPAPALSRLSRTPPAADRTALPIAPTPGPPVRRPQRRCESGVVMTARPAHTRPPPRQFTAGATGASRLAPWRVS